MSRLKRIKNSANFMFVVNILLLVATIAIAVFVAMGVLNPKKLNVNVVSKNTPYYIEIQETSGEYSYDAKNKYYYVLALTTSNEVVDLRTSSKQEADKLIHIEPGSSYRYVGKALPLQTSAISDLQKTYPQFKVSRYGLEAVTIFDYIFPIGLGLIFVGIFTYGIFYNFKSRKEAAAFFNENQYLNDAEADYVVCKGTEVVRDYLIQSHYNGKRINLKEFDNFSVEVIKVRFSISSYNFHFIKNGVKKPVTVNIPKVKKEKLEEFINYLQEHYFYATHESEVENQDQIITHVNNEPTSIEIDNKPRVIDGPDLD